jgi:DNA polymerase V
MRNAGIFDGDLLIVDRSIEAVHGSVVLAAINGEITCKTLDMHARELLSANNQYPPIPIHDGADFSVEGVVIYSIRNHRDRAG